MCFKQEQVHYGLKKLMPHACSPFHIITQCITALGLQRKYDM